jgi:hypothetical protein
VSHGPYGVFQWGLARRRYNSIEVSIPLQAALIFGRNLTRFVLEIYYEKINQKINGIGSMILLYLSSPLLGGLSADS